MFEPFIWMFKTPNFKPHFWYLFRILFTFFIPAVLFSIIIFLNYQNLQINILSFLVIIAAILFAAPFLCIQGYFWELTSQIISRDWDIRAANIYNGKVKQVYKIELPEIHTFKFIWRGIASVVANILMILPPLMIVLSSTAVGIFGYKYLSTNMLENPYYMYAIIAGTGIYWFLVPAFLWNYANRDSVVAVWNLRKAIFISGNYTGKYILNSILFCIFNSIPSYFLSFLILIFQLNKFSIYNPIFIINLFTVGILTYLMYIYCIYVNAYLLGTIAPPSEG